MARFGNRRYHATRGIALALHSLPGKLRHGRLHKLALRVTDIFGTAAPGLIVRASGPHRFRVTGLTDAHGRALLRIPKRFTGTLSIVVAGPAYARPAERLKVS